MRSAHLRVPDGILIDDYTLAGRAARKYFTSVREDALLYFHGGGPIWFIKFPPLLYRIWRSPVGQLLMPWITARTRHPIPPRLTTRLLPIQEMLNTPQANIVLAGDSAGGNLALACFLRIKREDCPCRVAESCCHDRWTGKILALPNACV